MSQIVFVPLLPWAVLMALAGLSLGAVLLGALRRPVVLVARGAVVAALLLALAGPHLRQDSRVPLGDIVLAVVDDSASQSLPPRPAQIEAALRQLRQRLGDQAALRVVRVPGVPGQGTALMRGLAEALARLPADRLAAVFVLTDGQVHDADLPLRLGAVPLHVGLTGTAQDWDRRLELLDAPAFGILDEPLMLRLRISDSGAAPGTRMVPVDIALDGAAPQRFSVPLGQEVSLPITLRHGGETLLRLSTPAAPGELTDRNNSIHLRINGVRDRLRVLLISGQPHPGGRTWRNLLKSDPAVDLVHFTILRSLNNQDITPVSEMSLIAFPTQELFMEKISEFQLIVFDRFQMRGILEPAYLDNIRAYVEGGGAVLVSAGPEFAGAQSLARTSLGAVLPARPTAQVVERAFAPRLTETGQRHPVTQDLPGTGDWGRWLRQVALDPQRGEVVLDGADGLPLLILDRVKDGRVALLASDQSWLWGRGYEGGGPQRELLRRLAHWMMKEPDLEEDQLRARRDEAQIVVTRRSLADQPPPLELTPPEGQVRAVPLQPDGPGRFVARLPIEGPGAYQLRSDDLVAMVGVDAGEAKEFADPLATPDLLAPLAEAQRGAVFALSEGVPPLRARRIGSPAQGRGWLGWAPRGASRSLSLTQHPLLPGWAWALGLIGLALLAWWIEGRRR